MIPNKGYLEAAKRYAEARHPEVAQAEATAMVAAALLEVAEAIRASIHEAGAKEGR